MMGAREQVLLQDASLIQSVYLSEWTGAGMSTISKCQLVRPLFKDIHFFQPEHGPLEQVCVENGLSCRVVPVVHRKLRRGFLRRTLWRDLGAVVASRIRFARAFAAARPVNACLYEVHCSPHVYGFLGARLSGAPVVARIHEARRPGWEEWLQEHIIVRCSDVIVTVSEGIRRQYGPAFQRKAKVIYNPIDPLPWDRLQAQRREGSTPRLALIANLHREKGVLEFLEIVAELHRRKQGCEALLVGSFSSSEFEAECRRKAHALRVDSIVRFMGWQTDVPSILLQTSILVHPTYRDSLPRVVMEAMAHGVPVVATKVDGLPEMVDHGTTGFLIERLDMKGFVDAIQTLLQNPALRLSMGQAGYQKACRQFAADVCREQWRELYTSLLNRKACHADSVRSDMTTGVKGPQA